MTGAHGWSVRLAFPLPPPEDAARIVAEHVRSDPFPEQCVCGSPYGSCWQRLAAIEALDAARTDTPS